jgi:signal transduction histidine kinase
MNMPDSTNKNILYIEDDLANRVLVQKVLSASNYNVLLAQNGLEGIKLASRTPPDLILLDISMAGLNGYETATSIKSTPRLASVPIVAVTANSLPGDKEKCLVAGCDGYISKPIDVSKFAEQVQSYLTGKSDTISSEQKIGLVEEYNAKLARRLKEKIEELERYNKALANELTSKDSQINHTKDILLESEKMASLGILAAGIAHEINNPMAYISSNMETIKAYTDKLLAMITEYDDMAKAGDKFEKFCLKVDQIKSDYNFDEIRRDSDDVFNETLDGIDRVKRIVQDIKRYAHNSSDKEFVSFDIHKCIDSSINIISNELKNSKVRLKKSYCDSSLVTGIESQISQVIINLMVNSIHSINDEGDIILTTTKSANMIEISVEDNGSGIPHDKINHIFDPFFTTKAPGKGTGLGLYICYDIIKKHGGEIGVTSELGSGTQFIFSLPAITH